MNYIYIGDIVNTHGIKGEVKIISHFKYKSNVFIKGTSLYVGRGYHKLIINSYFRFILLIDFKLNYFLIIFN